MKVAFIFSSLTFDIYKWCIFIEATKEYNILNSSQYHRKKTMLLITLILVQVFNFSSCGIVCIFMINTSDENITMIFKIRSYFFIAMFSCFFFFYIFVLRLLTKTLFRNYPKFYLRERRQIFIATGTILFSIAARMIFNFV